MLSQAPVFDPVPDRVVAAQAVSNSDCSLVESLQWQLYQVAPAPQTRFVFATTIHSSLHLSYVLIQSTDPAHLHLRSVGNSDCPNSEDKASFVQWFLLSPSVIPIQDSHNVVSGTPAIHSAIVIHFKTVSRSSSSKCTMPHDLVPVQCTNFTMALHTRKPLA